MNDNTSQHIYCKASKHLAQVDDDWMKLITAVGPCLLESKSYREPYEALARAVAYQQLHARAAEAILGRMMALNSDNSFPTPQQLLAIDTEILRRCGFSARKIITLKAIAEAAISGLVPNRDIADTMTDEELIERLTALPGIGRWTVEMLLMFTLGRQDIFPLDDFGVREGYRFIKSLDELPNRKILHQASLAYSPYRSIAAWYLWRVVELPHYQKRKTTTKIK